MPRYTTALTPHSTREHRSECAPRLCLRKQPRGPRQGKPALAVLPVIVPAFLLTGVEAIGQLARYVLFGGLMLWLELLALGVLSLMRKPLAHCDRASAKRR